MRFLLFIIANALLFIRPSELIVDLYAVELYRYAILACLAVTFPAVVQQLLVRYPGVPAIAGCVLGLFPAVLFSNLLGGNSEMILDNALEFAKVLIYYLLLLALLNSFARLERFLYWLSIFTVGLALIAVVRYHTDTLLPAPAQDAEVSAETPGKRKPNGTYVVDRVRDPQTGVETIVRRMCGTGIFNDPNDLALALVAAMPLCLYWITDPARRHGRLLWLACLLLCGYALLLTSSRGGFLALMGSLALFLHVRFGGRQTLLMAMLVFPLLLVVFAGRMTTISASDGTGQSRIQLWYEGLQYFQSSPLFGIGMENYQHYSTHVAHNSFIHCYTELGLLGGTLFLGAFYFALSGLYQLRGVLDPEMDPALRRLHPYLFAVVVAYTVGMLFLSRSYIVPTFMVLGLATVFLRLQAPQVRALAVHWNRLILPRLAGVSFTFLIVSYTFVRLFVNLK
jgi:hypothetical protein